mmetsp:Transcript_51453/g.95191  ORF Transcript_51453/g.95191 Transcript_51453/m.95191 type:complete len:595 (-) Transcript_51453:37-1821(-)
MKRKSRQHDFQTLMDMLRAAHSAEVEAVIAENKSLKEKLVQLEGAAPVSQVSPVSSPKRPKSPQPQVVEAQKSPGAQGGEPSPVPAESMPAPAQLALEEGIAVQASGSGNEPQPSPNAGVVGNIGNWVRRGSVGLMEAATAAAASAAQATPKGNNGGLPFPPTADAGQEAKGMYGQLQRWICSNEFESIFGVIIFLNALCIAAESQYDGWEVGYELGYPDTHVSSDKWPWGETLFDVLNWVFGLIFLIEVVLKLVALHFEFFKHKWHYFDTLLVIFWIVEVASEDGSASIISPSTLRVLRLMKVLRLVRVVRSIQGFDSLYIMTTALQGSFSVLAWSVALLALVLLMLALLSNQILVETYLKEENKPIEERLEVYEYFGTFSRALLSMFELTMANWPPICRLLMENVSEVWMVPTLLHKLTVGFAVIGVINGVFMQETFKVAATDDTIMVRQKQKAVNMHRKKMKLLFETADETGDGQLSLEEFRALLQGDAKTSQWIKLWLASMDLDVSDVDTLYHLIDDGDGGITADELVKGISKLKGPARSIDLHHQMRDYKDLYAKVQDMQSTLRLLSQRPNGKQALELEVFDEIPLADV